jgi:hypothetical protein
MDAEIPTIGVPKPLSPLIRVPKERLPPHGVWPRALARLATLPDIIFEVLRTKPNLVPFEDSKGKKAAKTRRTEETHAR